MPIRHLLGWGLLLFAATSLVVAVRDVAVDLRSSSGVDSGAAAPLSADRVTVYVLQGRAKCPTCDVIVRLTNETLAESYPDRVADGEIALVSANVEEKGNEWYIQAFELFSTSVVLARHENGKIVSWDNLEEVWDLAEKPDEFKAFLRGKIDGMLGGKGS